MKTISLANGDSRVVTKEFDNNAYICPWCEYPVIGIDCENPACLTQYKDIEKLQTVLNKIADQARLDQEHKKLLELRNKSYAKEY